MCTILLIVVVLVVFVVMVAVALLLPVVVVVAACCCYLAVGEGDLELLDGLGADVEAHPAVRDGVHVHNLVVGWNSTVQQRGKRLEVRGRVRVGW